MSGDRRFVFVPFSLDATSGSLFRGSEKTHLRSKSFALLRYLVEHPHRVVTKEELKAAVWPQSRVVDAALKVSVLEIRKALGDQALKPKYVEMIGRTGYRFIAPVSVALASEFGSLPSLYVVGRQSELELLRRYSELASQGKRQILFVTGEPGIGKTTLAEAFIRGVATGDGMVVAQGQCIEQYGAGEAYMPILDVLDRLCRGGRGQEMVEGLRRWAPSWLANLPALITAEERAELERQSVGIAPERRLRELGGFLEEIAREQTVLLILEDLHWLDPSSLALISFLARRREAARLMLIGTYRAGEVERLNHPLKAVAAELELHNFCVHFPLKLLSRDAVGGYLAARFETPAVANSLVSTVFVRSEGNPLFMVNVTDYLLNRDAIVREKSSVKLASMSEQEAVPGTIRQLIDRQLGEPSEDDQELLKTASVAGATFSVSAVARAIGKARETVEAQCRAMAEREQFLRYSGSWRSPAGTVTARYSFLHVLYQNVIYDRVGDARKARLHQRIGESIESFYQGATESVSAELALHFERAGDFGRAVKYLLQSAQRAMRQNAYQEALAHCENGLARSKSLKESAERHELEMSFHLLAGVCLASSQGYASGQGLVEFSQARRLASHVTNKVLLFQTLGGMWSYHLLRGDLRESLKVATTMLDLAHRSGDWSFLLNGNMVAGCSRFYLGDIVKARDHLATLGEQYDLERFRNSGPAYSWDPGVVGACYHAKSLWLLGYPELAEQQAQRAFDIARELSSPYFPALVNGMLAMYYTYRGDVESTLTAATDAISISIENGFHHWVACGTTLKGWALARKGHRKEGISCLKEGIDKWQSTGAQMLVPTYRLLQAEAHLTDGDCQRASKLIEECFAISRKNRESYYDAELHRLQGEIAARMKTNNSKTPGTKPGEADFLRALEVTRRQKTKSLELRATMSLCRLWRKTGKDREAKRMLGKIYGWFREGFDSPDLKAARTLLEEFS
jgi:DNA-binding winged helix-turn-helix (wHTH) protein/predicted ATPase